MMIYPTLINRLRQSTGDQFCFNSLEFLFQLNAAIHRLSEYSKSMEEHDAGMFRFEIIDQDDETYITSKFMLPNC